MKFIIFLLALSVACSCVFSENNIDAKSTLKESNLQRANWQKLAIDPAPWIGKQITLEGWLDFDIGYTEGNNTHINIYESPTALDYRLTARAVDVQSSAMEAACKDAGFSGSAIVKILKRKAIRITGTCEDSMRSPYNLVFLKEPLKFEVLRSQNIDNIPEVILEDK